MRCTSLWVRPAVGIFGLTGWRAAAKRSWALVLPVEGAAVFGVAFLYVAFTGRDRSGASLLETAQLWPRIRRASRPAGLTNAEADERFSELRVAPLRAFYLGRSQLSSGVRPAHNTYQYLRALPAELAGPDLWPTGRRLHSDRLRQRSLARRGKRGVQCAEIRAVECAPLSDRLPKIVARRLVGREHRRRRRDVAVVADGGRLAVDREWESGR